MEKELFKMPKKGQIITIDLGNDNHEYRVLKVNGRVAECLSMYSINDTQPYDYNLDTTIFDKKTEGIAYAWSSLDMLLNNTIYNSFSAEAKAAIQPTEIVQMMYMYSDEPNTPNGITYTYQYNWNHDYENVTLVDQITVGDRYLYALDIKDIFDYYNKQVITSDELNTLFYNTAAPVSISTWLRSAYAAFSARAWYVIGDSGDLGSRYAYNEYAARPAFQIDLSKINWS